jgi:hypothetical protein
MGAVEDYITYYGARQWQQLRTVFDHLDFKRTGYNDLFTDADKYVDFLEEIVPTFGADYQLEIERIVYTPGEKVAFAQFVEHLELKGAMTDIPETIIFDLNDDGLIRRMSLYIKQPGGPAQVDGENAIGVPADLLFG